MTNLYLASTPLNVLTATALASQKPSESHELWLIDQPDTCAPLALSLSQWQANPFGDIKTISHKTKGLTKKKRARKQSFKRIKSELNKLKPQHIYTGNDRRIEFQYAMHLSHQLNPSVIGHYMDDGTYSYIGKPSHWLKDRVIDHWAKKLSYGHWWKQPITVGASAWIDHVHLAYPSYAHPLLLDKQVHSLPNLTDLNDLDEWLRLSTPGFDIDVLSSVGAIWVLPHQSVIGPIDQVSEQIEILRQQLAPEQIFAVKNHPRNPPLRELIPNLQRVVELPAQIPFEMLIAYTKGIKIIGDFSTSLLFSKWLQPTSDVYSVLDKQNPIALALLPMMKDLGIQVETDISKLLNR